MAMKCICCCLLCRYCIVLCGVVLFEMNALYWVVLDSGVLDPLLYCSGLLSTVLCCIVLHCCLCR